MSVFLRCAICDRQQAAGIVSGAGWKTVELPAGVTVEHRAVKGGTARACPSCVGSNSDWQGAVFASLGVDGGMSRAV